MKTSVNILLNGKSWGIFKNSNGEYCRISSFYIRNKQNFQIIFSKNSGDIATRNAIMTTSEKKVLNLIYSENFKLETV